MVPGVHVPAADATLRRQPLDPVAGAVAAGVSLGAAELVSGFDAAGTSLVSAIGDELVDRFAASLKDLAVRLFGTNDKAALVVGIVVVSLGIGATLGAMARRHPAVAAAGFTGFGVVGATAYARSPLASAAVGVVAAAVGVAAGLVSLRLLLRLGSAPTPAPPVGAGPAAGAASRRVFLATAGALAVGAAGSAALGRKLRATDPGASYRATATLPAPASAVALPATQPFAPAGLSPYVTPTADFYRIDTALVVPRVDPASWRLDVGGRVDRPFSLTLEELLAMDAVEVPVTLQCVSNEVGGDLVGNAVWQGVPLASLLERAGVRPEGTQVVGRSVDGWTAGFPTELVDGERTALVAYAMNGEVLPARHGFPARLVVAGLYGYVSATKWLRSIELTRLEDVDGYWVPRGWAKDGPVKTTSRIDVPRSSETLPAGPVAIAGVAWAPTRGIRAVEVQIDDGAWQPCELGAAASDETWVQWHLRWDASPGEHVLRVRAVDGTGAVQDDEVRPPRPDGATGLHTRRVRIQP